MHTPECSEKKYVVAVCLSGVFGVVGIQHFYLGRWVEGFADVGLTFGAITFFMQGEFLGAAIMAGADFLHTFIVTIMLLTGSFKDGSGKIVCYPGQKLGRR